MSLAIHIPQFEGPLGLLLYLIRKEEMDIFDINIYLITSQYLDYIKKMKQFDLEVAGDFIAMAATLIQIKSKMLLPNYQEDGEEEENIDPRKELVQKLLEYQRFREASKKIYERPLLGRDLWKRGGKTAHFLTDEDGDIILDEGGLFSLIALYRSSIRKMKKTVHRVAQKTKSIASRILEMKDKLVVGQRVLMKDLMTSAGEVKTEILMTFLSVLELGKMGYVSVYQGEIYGDIYLTAKRSIEGNVVERVEEYDTQNSETIADDIMEKAFETELVEAEFKEEQMELGSSEVAEEEASLEIATDDEIIEAEKELDLNEGELSLVENDWTQSVNDLAAATEESEIKDQGSIDNVEVVVSEGGSSESEVAEESLSSVERSEEGYVQQSEVSGRPEDSQGSVAQTLEQDSSLDSEQRRLSSEEQGLNAEKVSLIKNEQNIEAEQNLEENLLELDNKKSDFGEGELS